MFYVLVIGAKGVGKSALIKAAFGSESPVFVVIDGVPLCVVEVPPGEELVRISEAAAIIAVADLEIKSAEYLNKVFTMLLRAHRQILIWTVFMKLDELPAAADAIDVSREKFLVARSDRKMTCWKVFDLIAKYLKQT